MPLRSTSMSVPRYLLFKNELANKSLVPQNSLLPQTNHTHEQGLCYALQIPCRASPYTVHDAVFSQQFLLTMCPFLESLASKSHGLRSYRRQKLYTAETEYNSSLAALHAILVSPPLLATSLCAHCRPAERPVPPSVLLSGVPSPSPIAILPCTP
jgi:hypothetical protein